MSGRNELRLLLLTALVEEHRALAEMMLGSRAAQQVEHELELTIGAATIHIVCLSGMGNVNAAARTATLLARLEPQFVILSGIAGGVKGGGDYNLGDIIIADQVILYEASKIRRSWVGRQVVERRMLSYPAGGELLTLARHLQVDIWPERVNSQLAREPTHRSVPKTVVGPIASGEKVVANRTFLTPLLSSYPLLKGIEMEGGGVAAAVHAIGGDCQCIVIKSVCDWADHEKNDGWHEFSSYASATFVKYLATRISSPQEPKTGPVVRQPASERTHSTTDGLFIEFLNPESQRIYGLDKKLGPHEKRTQAFAAINAAMFLCERGTIFPVGTFVETPCLLEMMPELAPFVSAGKLKFSMREPSVDDFLRKRRQQYRGQESVYPKLFEDGSLERLFPPESRVRKESHIGKRIAQTFAYGPRNLVEWESLAAYFSPAQIEIVSRAPTMLLEEERSITWTSLQEKVAEHGIQATSQLRRILQVTYCNTYASEYGLEFLRNVEFAPFEILPPTGNRRYDYGVLKRFLDVEQLWLAIRELEPSLLLLLLETKGHRAFMSAYARLCLRPIFDDVIDVVLRNVRSHESHENGRIRGGSSRGDGDIHRELASALRQLKADLAALKG